MNKLLPIKELPDYLQENLDIIIIGINPGVASSTQGHHYAGHGNHFWPCLFQSGLVTEPVKAEADCRILEFNIGLTNICDRPTKSSNDLSPEELREGGKKLKVKLINYAPKIAVFNGKVIYEYFSGRRSAHFKFGLQEEFLENSNKAKTRLYVMPSSSPRCASYPRASDKLPFYKEIKKLRDNFIFDAVGNRRKKASQQDDTIPKQKVAKTVSPYFFETSS